MIRNTGIGPSFSQLVREPLLTELLNPSDEAGAGVTDIVAGRPIAARACAVLNRRHATVHVCHLGNCF